jgi:hypothetical protein
MGHEYVVCLCCVSCLGVVCVEVVERGPGWGSVLCLACVSCLASVSASIGFSYKEQ